MIQFRHNSISLGVLLALCLPMAIAYGDPPITLHLNGAADQGSEARGVQWVAGHAGQVTGTHLTASRVRNNASAKFDGRRAILMGPPSNTSGFDSGFTWEGFFRASTENRYDRETGIADRLVTQFAFDKGDWTRLAIGLVADQDGDPRLGVELEGFDGRTFGLGKDKVEPGRWHHFALVHDGTADAARILWYLDYRLTGEVLLGGQADQNTLRPPGSARFTFGARLSSGEAVNRGFDGLIDELRLTPQPLEVAQFLRSDGVNAAENRVIPPSPARAEFWRKRHAWARQQASGWKPLPTAAMSPAQHSFDTEFAVDTESDLRFLRRTSLNVLGRIPTLAEIGRYLSDDPIGRRGRLVDRLLASPEWADAWVPFWQDLLAENPSVVYPTLNNSGPFRDWIYSSFRDNLPMDQFATELILMTETDGGSSTTGFALATGNDAPMAMKANIVLLAFAGLDLKCARCHDAPFDEFGQADLFRIAAYLNGGPLTVPATSVAASQGAAGPNALITTTLQADQEVVPTSLRDVWPKRLPIVEPTEIVMGGSSRASLAAAVTSARSPRFTDVIVLRTWQRFVGSEIIEWQDHSFEYERTGEIDSLSRDLILNDYDLKWLVRRILLSPEYLSDMSPNRSSRTMTAEQLVDSLFSASGKQFRGEVLGVNATDPGAVNLPRPNRSWQFASLPNERDRPALGMPVNQTIVDLLTVYGWNGNRQQPVLQRDTPITPLQPLSLSNGLVSQRIVRLSDDSDFTGLVLRSPSAEALVEQLFLAILTRKPSSEQRHLFVGLLSDQYENRLTGRPARPLPLLATFQADWRNHLQAEQTKLLFASQEVVAMGDPPTEQISTEFRERVEDIVWALINAPEFVTIR